MNPLSARIEPFAALIFNRARAGPRLECTVEHRQVGIGQMWRPLNRFMLVEVLNDFLNLARVVAQALQRTWHGLVDDLEHTAANQLLVLD